MTRHRLNPYKILILLLYADVSPITHLGFTPEGGVRLAIGTGGFARLLRVSTGRLHEYFQWLEGCGYLTVESRIRGELVATVHRPNIYDRYGSSAAMSSTSVHTGDETW